MRRICHGTLWTNEDTRDEFVGGLPARWNVADCGGIGIDPEDRFRVACKCHRSCTSGYARLVERIVCASPGAPKPSDDWFLAASLDMIFDDFTPEEVIKDWLYEFSQ
jgi:hypothetical protein